MPRTEFLHPNTGSMGLGHIDIRPGDLVCVFAGVEVPLVLRKSKVPESDALVQLDAYTVDNACTFGMPVPLWDRHMSSAS